MFKRNSIIFFLLFCITTIFSQVSSTVSLSKFSKVSIITSGPGEFLYEKFGHTAIRIKDPVLQIDLIYNYGIFDFENPNFYGDFTKGYMKYKLARYPFHYALKSNQENKRWVKEQVLNLNKEQKNKFFEILEINVLPKNAGYLYDPYFDNCATKARDIIKRVLGDNFIFKDDFISESLSIRQLMNKEINPNTWGSLGINVALGSRLDKIATANEYLYLPDYVLESLNYCKILKNGQENNLVLKTNVLLDFKEKEPKSDSISPFLVILLFSLVGLFITYKDYKNNKRSRWLDFILFFLTGAIGFLITYLWFFTNHSTAPNNFNFLWGFIPNLIISFLLLKKKSPKWITKYCTFLLSFLAIMAVIWITGVQLFSFTLIPLLTLLVTRYLFLQKTLNS